MTTETNSRAMEQAAAQYSSIVEMVAAVNCDYGRLEELKGEREDLTEAVKDAESEYLEATEDDEENEQELLAELEDARVALANWEAENAEELAELEDAAGDCEDEDEARVRIQEDPLEVQVRSDWTTVGEPLEAEEFMILLCTGGPAVRIVGELYRGEPCRAWIEYQDWFTTWTELFGASSDTLCEYAANFFFGE